MTISIYKHLGFNFTVDCSNFNIFKILQTVLNTLGPFSLYPEFQAELPVAIFRLDVRVLGYDGVPAMAFLVRDFRPAYAPLIIAAVLRFSPIRFADPSRARVFNSRSCWRLHYIWQLPDSNWSEGA